MFMRCAAESARNLARQLSTQKNIRHVSLPSYTPVVIVGGGPSGLIMSSLLSQYGIPHVLVERNAGLTQHPQAHYINNRSMEVFRGIPGLSQQVADMSPPLEQWRRFIYCESMLSGDWLGEVDHFPGQSSPHDATVSPEPVTHLSQHRLSQVLLQTAQQLAQDVGARILFGSRVDSVSCVPAQGQHSTTTHHHHHQQHNICSNSMHPPTEEYPASQQLLAPAAVSGTKPSIPQATADAARHKYPITVTLTCTLQQQQQQQQVINCSYLVAADGSHSTIRQNVGIQLQGHAGMQHLISIHFSWPQLGQALLQSGRQGMLYFVFNSQVVAVMVAHNLSSGEFVAQVPYFPPLQTPQNFTPQLCQQLIQAAVGCMQQLHLPARMVAAETRRDVNDAAAAAGDTDSLQIHSIKNWTMSAEVAEAFAACADRLLLIGDAVHRFPPAGGFGMNTGIQDAHNLAWKLAAVLKGCAHPELLASYQAERRPIAQANAELSVNNWHEAIRVPQALGLDPRAASILNALVVNAPLPAPAATWLLDAALSAGRGLAQALLPVRKRALHNILASGLSLRLQFPKEDLGFVYSQGAVEAAHGASAVQHPDVQQQHGRGSLKQPRSSTYTPALVPGGRLPHCWLEILGPHGQLSTVSTLDLCTAHYLGTNMLLLCSPISASCTDLGAHWAAAGLHLRTQGWPIQVVQVLPQGTDLQAFLEANDYCRQAHSSSSSKSTHDSVGPSSQLHTVSHAVDVEGCWDKLQTDGQVDAVLVRPDGHTAWQAVRGCTCGSSGSNGSPGDLVKGGAGEASSKQRPRAAHCVQVLHSVLQDTLHLVPQERLAGCAA